MNKPIRIVVLFLVILSINSICFGQQQENDSTESIIIITRARLDSLLAGIAKREKALLAKENQGYLNKPEMKPHIQATAAQKKQRKNQTNNAVISDSAIFKKLGRIDQTIGRLRMKIRKRSLQTKNNNNPARSGTTIIPSPAGHSSNNFYERGRPVVRNNARNSGDSLRTKIRSLRKKMTALQAKMSNLQKNPDAANHKEISRLRARIDSLNSSLKDANRSLELQPGRANKKKRNNSLSMLMQNYRQTIYFANNSTVLNSADKSLLLQLAQMIKRSGKQVTVLVQGYASHTGSALYNYKISLKRAEAVKNVLTNDGVNAEKIETIAHGISKSRSASAARRAEISLFVNG